jgi:hypothetical protein
VSDRFAQGAPGDGGALSIDLSGFWSSLLAHLGDIGQAIMQGFKDHIGEIGSTIWGALSSALYAGVKGLFLAVWNATFLTIPHDLTDRYAPVAALTPPPGAIAAGGLVLVIALLGLRTYVRGITGRGGILDEVLGRVMVYLSVLSILPWIISHAIDLEQSLAKSIAIADMIAVLPLEVGANDAITFTLSLAIMLVLGIRLWFKLASNLVHVMVAIVWSPVAMFCGLIPEASWVAGLWIREFTGRLAGAVLATIAVALGFALVLTNAGPLTFVGVGAAFLAAHDLVDWLARTPGTPMGGVVGAGARLGVGLMGGGGAASAGAQAAAMRSLARSDAARATERFYSFD